MIQTAKNMVFGHFHEFGAADQLDIAYFDRINVCVLAIVLMMLNHPKITKCFFE